MIFVTVGAQMPFDRLVRAVDDWARRCGTEDVLAQIGCSDWTPRHIRYERFIDPAEYEKLCAEARYIVAHAGTGAILTALHLGKPILVMPRRAALGETRNDHQLATVDLFRHLSGVHVAEDESQLSEKLARMPAVSGAGPIGSFAQPRLINALKSFIARNNGAGPIIKPNSVMAEVKR